LQDEEDEDIDGDSMEFLNMAA